MNCCSCNDIVGYRFHPSDKELIDHYLLNKSLDRDSSVQAIGEITGDLCDWEPDELPRFSARSSNDRTWYLFSRRKHSKRVKRTTKLGFWKLTGKHRTIKAEVGIGTKKTLVFYEGRVPKGKWTPWVIHEYTLPNTLSNQKGYFLCKLKKKDDGMADISSDQEGQPSKVEDANINMPTCNRNNNENQFEVGSLANAAIEFSESTIRSLSSAALNVSLDSMEAIAIEEDPMLTALKHSSGDFKAPLRIGAQSDMPNPRQSMEVEGKGKGKAIQQSPPSSPDISPPDSPRSVMGSSSSSVVQFQCNTSATQCPIQQQTTIQTTNNSLLCGIQAAPTGWTFDEAAHFTLANLNQYEVLFSGPELDKALNSVEFMKPIELAFKFGPSSPAKRPLEIPFKQPAKKIKYSIEDNPFLGSIMDTTPPNPAGQTMFEKELMEEEEEEFVNQFLVETPPKEHSSGGDQKEE